MLNLLLECQDPNGRYANQMIYDLDDSTSDSEAGSGSDSDADEACPDADYIIRPRSLVYLYANPLQVFTGVQQLNRKDYRSLITIGDPLILKQRNLQPVTRQDLPSITERTETNGVRRYMQSHGYVNVPEDYFDDARQQLSQTAERARPALKEYLHAYQIFLAYQSQSCGLASPENKPGEEDGETAALTIQLP